MTEASNYLFNLAQEIAQPYISTLKAQAFMVTGSVAEGQSDFYSDIDMTAYYDELPTEAELQAAREQNHGSERLWLLGDRKTGSFAEAYLVRGVECQIGHTTIAAWEQSMAAVRETLDVASPLQKALSGTLICIPLHGEALINQWKTRLLDYPPELGRAMVTHYLRFFPIWGLQEWLITRDATIWRYQIFVEAAQNLLGILAGLNRCYYTTFQFKRMRQFIQTLALAPPNLAERIETLFEPDLQAGAAQLEKLVTETVALVKQHMPEIDTSSVERRLGGWRREAWKPDSGR
jgi:hypothetical protein